MKDLNQSVVFLGVVLVLSGCASLPDKQVTYYLPKTTVKLTVTQSVLCIDPSNPVVETKVEFDPKYSANLEKPHSINFSDLDTFYSTGTASITLTEDGRLEGFNTSSTGAVSDSITTLVTFLGAISPMSGDEAGGKISQADVDSACGKINKITGGKPDKPLSIVLTSLIDFREGTTNANFNISGYPESFYQSIIAATGKFSLGVIEPSNFITKNGLQNDTSSNKRTIKTVEPKIVPIKVIRTSFPSYEITEYLAKVPVSQWGNLNEIPIPNPPMFGTNTLDLTLFGSGKIKNLKYGTTNGAKDLGNAFKALGDGLNKTDAEKTVELKNEADLIAAQQRLLKCKTTAECK